MITDPSIVDLRSDTVTRPTAEMISAMATAPLGDDVLGDDPTVQELERLAASTLGMQAGLFVPSGTMGNQIAIAAQIDRGDSILCEEESHILYYECGAPAVLAGGVTLTMPSDAGILDPDEIERRAIRRSLHSPGTTLLCLENTHNRAGGTIVPVESFEAYRAVASRHGMRVHLDGARLFNASVASRRPASEFASFVDTASICLSKGLSSPVGSVLCGSSEFVERARVWRKRLGGGMRQAGVLAACGIVSLKSMVERLADDHDRARQTATELAGLSGLKIDLASVQTNMVLIATERPADVWLKLLRELGVWALPPAEHRIRLVFHKDIDDQGVRKTIEAFDHVASRLSKGSVLV